MIQLYTWCYAHKCAAICHYTIPLTVFPPLHLLFLWLIHSVTGSYCNTACQRYSNKIKWKCEEMMEGNKIYTFKGEKKTYLVLMYFLSICLGESFFTFLFFKLNFARLRKIYLRISLQCRFWPGAWDFTFLTGSQVIMMLLVLKTHSDQLQNYPI